jgi:putative hydrolase of the HAD superfamily
MNNPSSLPVKTILFDMDNTLFDLEGAQIASCHDVARHLGLDDGETLYNFFLRPVHGFEAHENILDYLNEHDLSTNGTFHQVCRLFEEKKLHHISPYESVMETLTELRSRGYPMAIVTDAHSRDATRRLEKTGLLPFFSGMVCYDMVRVKKPAPLPFLTALEMMKSGAHETILVGDSPRRDIEPCRNLGIRTVYARYGDCYSRSREDVKSDFTIDSLKELLNILSRI